MGCDIHMHLEVKVAGKWEHFGSPSVPRSYRLFSLLAGVRSAPEERPIVAPKGLPSDPSVVTAIDFAHMAQDAHTPSWLNAEEIVAVTDAWAALVQANWPDKAFDLDMEHGVLHTYFFGNSWAGFHKYPSDRPEGIEDVRWVFWFDN